DKEILERNPFQSIDVNGVGSLMKIGITNGRSVKPNMEIGICGEHGGDPNSIKFCHNIGLSYVSASPHRIPIAIVAAAQAALEQPKKSSKNTKPKKRLDRSTKKHAKKNLRKSAKISKITSKKKKSKKR
ncbi:MAG: pyruvate, phosphate dikinase, partial [Nitrosopumilales archaeon CG15_BIG_FIL_POST_REV_8_21_14_020_37_12]